MTCISVRKIRDLKNELKSNIKPSSYYHAQSCVRFNVACVLSDLGAQVTVTGFLGDDNDAAFRQLFAQMGAQDAFIRIAGATRINVKLVEQS